MSRDAIVLAVAGVADQCGLFATIAASPSAMTAAEIATAGALHPRYVEEICACLACAEILGFDKETQKFSLTAAKAKCLTDASFPLGVGGWLEMLPALYRAVPEVTAATRSPDKTTGVPMSKFSEWGFTRGMDRLNTPGIMAGYVRKWLPSSADAVQKLEQGCVVADLGTGCGAVAISLATAFPKSQIVGVDLDEFSIQSAEAVAAPLGLPNLRFLCKDMIEMEPNTFDLITNRACMLVDLEREMR